MVTEQIESYTQCYMYDNIHIIGCLKLKNCHGFLFWFLVCYATTHLATQLRQRCIQLVRSNKEAQKRLTESNGTPEMDLVNIFVVLKWYDFYVLFYECLLK